MWKYFFFDISFRSKKIWKFIEKKIDWFSSNLITLSWKFTRVESNIFLQIFLLVIIHSFSLSEFAKLSFLFFFHARVSSFSNDKIFRGNVPRTWDMDKEIFTLDRFFSFFPTTMARKATIESKSCAQVYVNEWRSAEFRIAIWKLEIARNWKFGTLQVVRVGRTSN